MNIRDWSMDEIMKLPDHLFGRRYEISALARGGNTNFWWEMSQEAFPEVGVIWQIIICPQHADDRWGYVRVGMGDRVPTSAAEMNRLEPLFPGMGIEGIGLRQIRLPGDAPGFMMNVRRPVRFGGRRLVVEAYGSAGKYSYAYVVVVVSRLPETIPDWSWWLRQKDFVGGRAKRS